MTPGTELIENSNATFSVYTAPRGDDGAFVLVADTRADGLDHCIALIDHYSVTKDVAGAWRVRVFAGRDDLEGRHAGTYDSRTAAHQWIAHHYRQTHAPARSTP